MLLYGRSAEAQRGAGAELWAKAAKCCWYIRGSRLAWSHPGGRAAAAPSRSVGCVARGHGDCKCQPDLLGLDRMTFWPASWRRLRARLNLASGPGMGQPVQGPPSRLVVLAFDPGREAAVQERPAHYYPTTQDKHGRPGRGSD